MIRMLSQIAIDKFVVHDVPVKRSQNYLQKNVGSENTALRLSNTEVSFSNGLRDFFIDKLVRSIGSSQAFNIKFKTEEDIVPEQVKNYFNDNNRYIEVSQEIAKHLYEIQDARHSDGLLIFVFCHVGNIRAVAILKVEREDGVQINLQENDDGYTTFDMNHIENLMLTKKTKLFKITMFYLDDASIKGIMCDQQMGANTGKLVALYFLDQFLSCEFIDEPSVVTQKFFSSAKTFINNSNMSSEKKASAINHLISALTNNSVTINKAAFARDSLDLKYADDFIRYMEEQGVSDNSFVKDTSSIDHQLKKMQFIFDNGISVIAPQDASANEFKYEGYDDGKIKMQILGSLKKVGTK